MNEKKKFDVIIFFKTFHHLGNINKDRLFDIWNSKEMKNFQQMHLEETAHKNEHCLKCINHTS